MNLPLQILGFNTLHKLQPMGLCCQHHRAGIRVNTQVAPGTSYHMLMSSLF
jgi:hypothetical protein